MRTGERRDLAVVTVNWNGWRHTLNCLSALKLSAGVEWRLFIVDNGSTDGSPERLSGLGENVTLICSPRNGGWTGGNNLGVQQALREGFEHILLLNNDANVRPETLAAFMAAQGLPQAQGAILGGVLRSETGEEESQAGSRLRPETGLVQWISLAELGAPSGDGLLPTATVCGGALFAHRSVFEAVGPFDDDFYLYYDESDWCLRAAGKGRRCWVADRAVVHHVGLASTGGKESPIFNYFITRNSLLFGERHCSGRQRTQIARNVLGALRRDARSAPGGFGPLRIFAGGDAGMRARRRGLIDYAARRFGDCPQSIRRLQEEWRSARPSLA
jgi:GT2 family glycosyltransferase